MAPRAFEWLGNMREDGVSVSGNCHHTECCIFVGASDRRLRNADRSRSADPRGAPPQDRHCSGQGRPAPTRLGPTTPKKKAPPAPGITKVATLRISQDNRLPMPGAVITREYKGETIEVRVLPGGFEYEGEMGVFPPGVQGKTAYDLNRFHVE